MKRSVRLIGLLCIAAAFALDQATKALALAYAQHLAAGIEVLPVFNMVLVRNPGVSFGMLGGVAPWWVLSLLSLALMACMSVWLWRSQSLLVSVALGLVIGGALGNVVDRLRHRAVTDFLDFHAAGYHWPAFNMADVVVVCGAALLLLDSLRGKKHQAIPGG